ncbi:MAG: Gfo/Idh/MocA family oxidoreductase [Nitrososphaerota archaeon]|jgi:predicted dehydrogenase|nr:Gfo/Idh/MocA family oxidoreductase [Nitrososphaerota archaeon]MDG6947237.1 Gfo/Idh/MocA family oxidoreductase [Nitrososphaerota archaeon]MDG6955330.1 Gfo/Idh/MocA family oxidoreductase [Nitrososphaerota archaeon]
MDETSVAIVGCGVISEIYLKNLTGRPGIRVKACADLIPERAAARAAQFNVPKSCSVDEVMDDNSIDVVLNLTVPKAHGQVTLAAIEKGKSVYGEKPLAATREEGQAILRAAKSKGVRVGCAPDTVLGGGLQTARKFVDDGRAGFPVAATAFMASHGPESWHGDPRWFYERGSGPLFDMGPYYLTALVNVLGPVRRVTSSARKSFPERIITSREKYGTKINVEVPTHVAAVLDFRSGVICSLMTTFDVWAANLPWIELYCSEGTVEFPDPNSFSGPVRYRMARTTWWENLSVPFRNTTNMRGLGLVDMVEARRRGREHRASLEVAYHVLDVMQAIHESSEAGRHVEIQSSCERPEPMPVGAADFVVDA